MATMSLKAARIAIDREHGPGASADDARLVTAYMYTGAVRPRPEWLRDEAAVLRGRAAERRVAALSAKATQDRRLAMGSLSLAGIWECDADDLDSLAQDLENEVRS